MLLISHRGNVKGRFEEFENSPSYIDKAIELGYDVEVDIRYISEVLYLGHDLPQYEISQSWLEERYDRLWIHCKNIEAVEWFNLSDKFNYFWHHRDTVTLTSNRDIWAFPGKQPIRNSIAVLPELYKDTIEKCKGICSDNIENYKK